MEKYNKKGLYAAYDKNHKERQKEDYYATPPEEVDNILRLMGVSYILEGNGYVYEQSIPVGEVINDTITIKLKNKYTE